MQHVNIPSVLYMRTGKPVVYKYMWQFQEAGRDSKCATDPDLGYTVGMICTMECVVCGVGHCTSFPICDRFGEVGEDQNKGPGNVILTDF